MCGKLKALWVLLFWLCFSAVVLQAEEPEPGGTLLLSPGSGQRLSGSGETLRTWESLSARFQAELTALQADLKTALKEAQASATSFQKLTLLYETSLTRIENLEGYNQQIAERMEERDMDLAAAYQELDGMEKRLLKKDNAILRMSIAIGLLGLAVLVIAALAVRGKMKLSENALVQNLKRFFCFF